MGRWISAEVDTTTVRDSLIARYERLSGVYGHLPGCPWPGMVDRLVAGESNFEFGLWEIPREYRGSIHGATHSRWILEPDDSVRPMDPMLDRS